LGKILENYLKSTFYNLIYQNINYLIKEEKFNQVKGYRLFELNREGLYNIWFEKNDGMASIVVDVIIY
jgi:hypothetical protein